MRNFEKEYEAISKQISKLKEEQEKIMQQYAEYNALYMVGDIVTLADDYASRKYIVTSINSYSLGKPCYCICELLPNGRKRNHTINYNPYKNVVEEKIGKKVA